MVYYPKIHFLENGGVNGSKGSDLRAVCKALVNDGWTITDDPLTLSYEDKSVFPDLGAQRSLLGAERGLEKLPLKSKVLSAVLYWKTWKKRSGNI